MALKNLGELKASINRMHRFSKRSISELMNKAMKDVAFRAMSYTTFATPDKIESDMKRNGTAFRAARARLGSGATKKEIKDEAAKIVKTRKSRSKARRAGWIPAIKAFGGSIRGAGTKKANSSANNATEKMATEKSLKALIENTMITRDNKGKVTGVGDMPDMEAALQKAVDYVASDRNKEAFKREVAFALKTV